MPTFSIQGVSFDIESLPDATKSSKTGEKFPVRSQPRAYFVEFISDRPIASTVELLTASVSHSIVIADQAVLSAYPAVLEAVSGLPMMAVEATEVFKSVESALALVEFMDLQRMSKSSQLIAIGGGIIQDVAAFGACVYKRGVPWTYIPTTLLAQADSCIGAKSGLNFRGAKNLVGVFSAPRRIAIHPGFLASLTEEDILSGLGEVFRLSVIGGSKVLTRFEESLPAAAMGDALVLEHLVRLALTIKRAVVEFDEFELDLRRSMNFGHSIGHALEAMTDYSIPHGTAVAVGVLVESDISYQRGMLPAADRTRLLRAGGLIINDRVRQVLESVSFDLALNVLFQDKKTEGSTLKLVVPEQIGTIRFVDLPLDDATVPLLRESLGRVLGDL